MLDWEDQNGIRGYKNGILIDLEAAAFVNFWSTQNERSTTH